MDFRNKRTGVILKVTNEFVLEQIKKSNDNDYEEIKTEKKSSKKKEQ